MNKESCVGAHGLCALCVSVRRGGAKTRPLGDDRPLQGPVFDCQRAPRQTHTAVVVLPFAFVIPTPNYLWRPPAAFHAGSG